MNEYLPLHKKHLIIKCKMWIMDACLFIGIIMIWRQSCIGLYFARSTLLPLPEVPLLHPGAPQFLTPTTSYQSFRTWLGGGLGLRGLLFCASRAYSVYLYLALISWDWHFLLSLSPHPSRLSCSSLAPWCLTSILRHWKQTVHVWGMEQWRLLRNVSE